MTDSLDQPETTITVSLRDGTEADLKPLTTGDGDLLRDGLSQLSAESRRNRFGVAVDHLSSSEVEYLTDVDQVNHVAWGATIDDQPAGLGRYILLEDEDCAEIAVTVVDRFQRRGLGSALFDALAASARAGGIEAFCFWVEPDNVAVLRMLQGIETTLDESGGLITGRIPLRDVARGENDEAMVELLTMYQN
jgi:GNAT superfamily N-acetyltransferase